MMVMTAHMDTLSDQDNGGHGADPSNYYEAVTSTEVEMLAYMKTRRLLDIDNGMKNLSLSPKNSLVEEEVWKCGKISILSRWKSGQGLAT